MFFGGFCEISKNTSFTEHLPWLLLTLLEKDSQKRYVSDANFGGYKTKLNHYLIGMGDLFFFQVYGIDMILTVAERKKLSNSNWPFLELTISDMICSTGEIDILTGIEYAGCHTFREQSTDHLIVLGKIWLLHVRLSSTVGRVDKAHIEVFYEA